jgi:hypothetical protein
MLGIVGWMPLTVVHNDLMEIERGHALQASDVDAQLIGVRAALVVDVNPEIPAKMMLGGHGVEPIGRDHFLAFHDLEGIRR